MDEEKIYEKVCDLYTQLNPNLPEDSLIQRYEYFNAILVIRTESFDDFKYNRYQSEKEYLDDILFLTTLIKKLNRPDNIIPNSNLSPNNFFYNSKDFCPELIYSDEQYLFYCYNIFDKKQKDEVDDEYLNLAFTNKGKQTLEVMRESFKNAEKETDNIIDNLFNIPIEELKNMSTENTNKSSKQPKEVFNSPPKKMIFQKEK